MLQNRSKPQKLRVPSPLRPHTTMAMEKLNMAARDAQAKVNSIDLTSSMGGSYLGSDTKISRLKQLS